jgi:hypothetical protein
MHDRIFKYLDDLANTERRIDITFAGLAMMFDISVQDAANIFNEWMLSKLLIGHVNV